MSRDLKLLQGTWSVATLEVDGGELPASMLENARVVIRSNRFISTGMGAVFEGTLELDESTRPRQLTMKFDAGPEKGNTNLCIYDLDDDTWKMCIATHGKVRPKRFVSQPGSGFAVETLKRGEIGAKAKAKSQKQRQAAARTSGTAAATELEGEWQMISGIFDGKAMDPSETKWVRRVTQLNQTTVTAGPQIMMKFEFAIDSAHSPRHVDYVLTAGAAKGNTQRGIYELKEDLLTICVSVPGNPRPIQFESKPGSGCTLTAWKRL